jgi:hypothetical protein
MEYFVRSQGRYRSEFFLAECVTIGGAEAIAAFLAIQAAAARIAFVGDNYATRLRLTLLIAQAYGIGVAAWWSRTFVVSEGLYIMLCIGALMWGVAGALMMGESDEIAPRAQRELPMSFLGRLMLGWLYPGAASGYFFVLANIGLLVLAALAGAYYREQVLRMGGGRLAIHGDQILWLGMYLLGTAAFQLGVGRLLVMGLEAVRLRMMRMIPSFAEWQLGPAESLLIHIILTITFAAGSYTVAM